MNSELKNEIIADGIHIATIVKPNFSSEGLSFITNDTNFIQVGLWNYKKRKTA